MTYKEISATEWYATLGVPLLGCHELTSIPKQHILDAGIQDYGLQRPLGACTRTSPVVVPDGDRLDVRGYGRSKLTGSLVCNIDCHAVLLVRCVRCLGFQKQHIQ